MGEDLQWRHHFVECVLVADLDVVSFFKGVEEELAEAVLRADNASLVFELGGPDSLELLLLPDCGGFVDGGIVFREGGLLLVECRTVGSRRRRVDGVDQDKPGYFSGRAAGEVD